MMSSSLPLQSQSFRELCDASLKQKLFSAGSTVTATQAHLEMAALAEMLPLLLGQLYTSDGRLTASMAIATARNLSDRASQSAASGAAAAGSNSASPTVAAPTNEVDAITQLDTDPAPDPSPGAAAVSPAQAAVPARVPEASVQYERSKKKMVAGLAKHETALATVSADAEVINGLLLRIGQWPGAGPGPAPPQASAKEKVAARVAALQQRIQAHLAVMQTAGDALKCRREELDIKQRSFFDSQQLLALANPLLQDIEACVSRHQSEYEVIVNEHEAAVSLLHDEFPSLNLVSTVAVIGPKAVGRKKKRAPPTEIHVDNLDRVFYADMRARVEYARRQGNWVLDPHLQRLDTQSQLDAVGLGAIIVKRELSPDSLRFTVPIPNGLQRAAEFETLDEAIVAYAYIMTYYYPCYTKPDGSQVEILLDEARYGDRCNVSHFGPIDPWTASARAQFKQSGVAAPRERLRPSLTPLGGSSTRVPSNARVAATCRAGHCTRRFECRKLRTSPKSQNKTREGAGHYFLFFLNVHFRFILIQQMQ